MKFDFFTLGGRFFWEDIFYYQGWKIQRKNRTNRYRLLDSHNIRREKGTFEICKDTLLKYISACEIDEPKKDIVVLIPDFGRTQKSLRPLEKAIRNHDINAVIFNYCSLSSDLKTAANSLLTFVRNFTNSPNIFFVTFGSGCLVLRKMFSTCDDYRTLHIKGIINVNPLNSGSDFAFLLNKISVLRKIFGRMLFDITPDEALKLTKIPQDIPFYLLFAPSKLSDLNKRFFSKLESFPQLSPPAESSYSQNSKEVRILTWLPLNNENMHNACIEILEDLLQNEN